MRIRSGLSRQIWLVFAWLGSAALVMSAVGCTRGQAVLTQQVDADRVAGALHVEFARANEATNRAVLADTEEASTAAAQEAKASMTAAADSLARLRPLLTSLGYASESAAADAFDKRFAELQTLDAEILPLAVENTNLKAQRLAFGDAQAAVDATVTALRSARAAGASTESDVVVERIIGALLEIQVLQTRHIAESDEAAMSRMESRMHEEEGVALRGVARLRQIAVAGVRAKGDRAPESVEQADQAIERFLGINQQIVDLSRRNTNVRSLALTLGRRRVVAAECEDQLRALQTALSVHEFKATR